MFFPFQHSIMHISGLLSWFCLSVLVSQWDFVQCAFVLVGFINVLVVFCHTLGKSCCPFLGGGSVVVCSLFCFGGFCVGLCFVMHFFVSFLVLQSSWRGIEAASCFALIVFLICHKMALPRGAVGWFAVSNFYIS